MPGSPTYKRLTLQQLRSLCETGRLGSFWAAAHALDVSHPTVWKQVHALEREFHVRLVETDHSGCQLTPAGRLLVEMAGPATTAWSGISSLIDTGYLPVVFGWRCQPVIRSGLAS